MFPLLGLFSLAAFAAGADPLDLAGQIDPPPAQASVSISGVATDYAARTTANDKGRFRFKKLPPGAYVVTVFARGVGMTRRSVDVTPSLAGAQGRVSIAIPFSGAAISTERSPRARNTVSLKELAISGRARREFDAGRERLRKRDTAGAVKHLKKAVELAPQFTMAWNELGMMAYRARDWNEAETCFRKALELRPGSLMTTLHLGGVLLYLEKAQDALPYNRFAVERSPNSALANFQFGMNCFLLARDDDAIKYLKIAKSLDPAHYSNPQLVLAVLYSRRGDAARAVAEMEEFLALHPDSTNAGAIRSEIARLKTPAARPSQ